MAGQDQDFEFKYIVRIAGHDLRGEYFVINALGKIKGVGRRLAHIICNKADVPINVRIGFLTNEELERIEAIIDNPTDYNLPGYLVNRPKDIVTGKDSHVHAQDLAIALKDDLDRMKKMRSYKGIRHQLGLRVRGQRTRTTGRKLGRSSAGGKRK
jgi:ribosomal protein S13